MMKTIPNQDRLARPVCALAVAAILCGGCATTQDGRTAQAQGAGIGAVGGAILGAVIGNQTGLGSERGALIGAAAGGAAGFAYGTHVANQKAKYKSTEEWLDACIADAEKKHRSAVAYNKALDSKLARLQGEVKAAKAKGDQNKLKSLKQEILAEQSNAEKQVASTNKEIELQQAVVKEAGGTSRASALRSKLNSLGSANASTKKSAQSLAQLSNSTGV